MLVDHALAVGYDPARGQLYEYGSAYGRAIDRSVQWWAQFEFWNALFLMHEIHGQETPRYWDAAMKAWSLTVDALTDKEHPGVAPRWTSTARSTAPRRATRGS